MLTFLQSDFSGGMNALHLDHQLADNQYKLLFNGRNRYGYIEPVKRPLEIDPPVEGITRMQGLFTAGNLIVIFADGLAYYRFTTSTTWTQIAGFAMSALVDTYYAQAVPASSINSARRLRTALDIGSGAVLSGVITTGTPQALLVQDGVNQPWVIFPDGTARVTKTYAQWTVDNREYVPIGKQMVFNNNKLYIVAPDGLSIYQSVSGRPLDFGVNINTGGVMVGDATTVSFAIDYNVITYIGQINTGDIMVATAFNCYKVIADYQNTIFGEPDYVIQKLFIAGVVNQFSVIDMLGDSAFIDFDGIKSFNAVQQLYVEGKNSVFSQMVASLFKGIRQTDCAAVAFDNYGFFAIQTTFGHAILVYDTISQVWSSIDINLASKIKQFAITYTDDEQQLWAITHNQQVFRLYASDDWAIPTLYTRAFIISQSADVQIIGEHKSRQLRCINESGTIPGTLRATELVDGRLSGGINRTRSLSVDEDHGIYYPVQPPVGPLSAGNSVADNAIVFGENATGFKISYLVSWNNDSRLSMLQLNSDTIQADVSQQQKRRIYANAS